MLNQHHIISIAIGQCSLGSVALGCDITNRSLWGEKLDVSTGILSKRGGNTGFVTKQGSLLCFLSHSLKKVFCATYILK